MTDVGEDMDAALDDDGPRHLAPTGSSPGTSGIDRRLIVAAAVLVLVLVAAAVLVLRRSGGDDGEGGEVAGEIVDVAEIAEVAPRLLVTADGWSVTSADQLDLAHGEMTSSGPDGELTLMWTPDDGQPGYPTHDETLADLAEGADRLPDATVAGETAAVFHADTLFHALWRYEGYSIGAVGRFATVDDFLSVAATLEPVGVDDWLAALPDAADPTTAPSPRGSADGLDDLRTADDVLDGVPLPAGLDRTALDGTTADDPYQLGREVLGPVVCGWYDQWEQGLAAGDTAAAAEAADALGASPSWFALQAMSTAGDWPLQVWDLASALPANTSTVPDAYTQNAAATACPA